MKFIGEREDDNLISGDIVRKTDRGMHEKYRDYCNITRITSQMSEAGK
jgi:hypothetical protein